MPAAKLRVKLSDDFMTRDRAMAVAGSYWSKADRAWMVDDPSPRACAVILALFPYVMVDHPELLAIRDSLYGDARPTDHAALMDLTLDNYALAGRTLYRFQDRDAAFLKLQATRLGAGFLGWDRGLGKTTAAIAMCDSLDAKRILVVCSNTAKGPVWEDEIRALWPGMSVQTIPNAKGPRERMLRTWEVGKGYRASGVFVVHYEALAIIAGDKGRGNGWDKLGDWDVMIFDEAHRLASMNPNSKGNTQLGRATMKARKHAKIAFALTGTSIMNKGDDLFGQLHFLFPDTYKAKWRDWNDRYLEYVKTGYGQVCIGFNPAVMDQLRAELGVFMVHRLKEDELDLPKRTEETRYVHLSPGQRAAYDDMAAQFWTELESGEFLQAGAAIAQLQLLRRIATGLDAVSGVVKDSSKLDFALDLVESNPDEAFVIFSWYKAPLAALQERLEKAGVGVFAVTGDVPQATRTDYVERFQRGEGRVFLGTISTLSESVNLQRASSAIFLDRSWNPAQNAQAADRIYRIGQERPVTITHLVAKDTIDETRVQPVLAQKDSLRRAVFGAR